MGEVKAAMERRPLAHLLGCKRGLVETWVSECSELSFVKNHANDNPVSYSRDSTPTEIHLKKMPSLDLNASTANTVQLAPRLSFLGIE